MPIIVPVRYIISNKTYDFISIGEDNSRESKSVEPFGFYV